MPYVHRIDPVIASPAGVALWWYGFSYTLGFAELHAWFRLQRERLGLSLREVYDITIFIAAGVLVGGRAVEVLFYEWPFYSARPELIPALWLGGMATHGLLLGAAAGVAAFCLAWKRDFLTIADELVIPGAFLMGVGRIGNFIDGQIVGSVTAAPWGVLFPDAEGFRHPVVLYDGVKNLLLIPLLLAIRRREPPRGVMTANFFFWYASLRIFVDVYREYPTTLFGVATGQGLNVAMTIAGVVLLAWALRTRKRPTPRPSIDRERGSLWPRRIALALILLFCLLIPSDWTQDVPRRYGKRHPGLEHSWLYPPIESRGE